MCFVVFFELFIKERWAFRKVTHLSIFILMTSIPNHLHSVICKDVILTKQGWGRHFQDMTAVELTEEQSFINNQPKKYHTYCSKHKLEIN